MKILVVTNLYPPQHIGGYELGCRDVVEQLRARGHTVRVLTSAFRRDKTENPPGETEVERVLQCNLHPTDPAHNKRGESRKFAAAVKAFAPEIVYFWNLAGLSFWLPFTAHWRGCRMVFFLSDTNFVSWRIGAWLAGWAQIAPHSQGRITAAAAKWVRALFGNTFLVRGWPVVRNRTCHYCSDFIHQTAVKNGIAGETPNAIVAHWGIAPKEFPPTPRRRWPVTRLLYAGQMVGIKGVHTAIAAFGLVARERGFEGLTLTLAGGGQDPDYERKLGELAAKCGVAGRVRFLGRVPLTELPRIYGEHDVLIFPSEWDEPFAITPLEAIACGLAVIGTTTGGSGELFRNRETAMTFRAGDAADGARAIRELCADRELFEAICRNAQREVREKHTLEAMVDKIESSLKAEIKVKSGNGASSRPDGGREKAQTR